MPDPRFFKLSGRRTREVPASWLYGRGRTAEDDADAALGAIEVAPGVRVALVTTGDSLVPADSKPGYEVLRGAMIAVFTDAFIAGLPGACTDCPDPARCERNGCHGMDGVMSPAEIAAIGTEADSV